MCKKENVSFISTFALICVYTYSMKGNQRLVFGGKLPLKLIFFACLGPRMLNVIHDAFYSSPVFAYLVYAFSERKLAKQIHVLRFIPNLF